MSRPSWTAPILLLALVFSAGAKVVKLPKAGQVVVTNCHQDKKPVNVWYREVGGEWKKVKSGLTATQDSVCPAEDSEKETIDLEDGKDYEIVTTDGPHNDVDCSTDDPEVVNCQRLQVFVRGEEKAGAQPVTSP